MLVIRRELPIVTQLIKTSVLGQMQYRLDFVLELVMAVFWVGWNVAPVFVVFEVRPTISAFTLEEALLVMSAFLILKALVEGLVSPNLLSLVEHVRNGTLDFVLLKPADSQLLVSTSRLRASKLIYLLAGSAMAVWSLDQIEPSPGARELLVGAAMLMSGAALLYSMWLILICSAFWFVRVDNLSYLFNSIFDAARWPIGVFRGWVRAVLTFVIPIAVMTSYPAHAALGDLSGADASIAFLAAAFSLIVSRRVWRRAVMHYSSASS